MTLRTIFAAASAVAALALAAAPAYAADTAKVAQGQLKGATAGQVTAFKAIPFAAPPVGDLRWRPPQPAKGWSGVRDASAYGPMCWQMRATPNGTNQSEDCLTLNVWTPVGFKPGGKLPVLVFIHGGSFTGGSGSNAIYDGTHFAERGVVLVTVNYRLGRLGFFAHPALTAEQPAGPLANYGMMDNLAALRWVQDNIAAFGGDPKKVTIFGESAGSFSVNAQMASPRARGLFVRAIGESGAFWGNTLRAKTLADSEAAGVKFADSLGAHSLAGLRAKSAQEMLDAQLKAGPGTSFIPNVDGYFLPDSVATIFADGKQAKVPLLAGWNADEMNYRMLLRNLPPTTANLGVRMREQYGADADKVLKLYPADTDDQAKRAAQDLASDQFIAYGTWKWIEIQAAARQPVWRYRFDQASAKDSSIGAVHASEIPFVFQTLKSQDQPWRQEDFWTNFAKTGNPNGKGLPEWPAYSAGRKVMHLAGTPNVTVDDGRARYDFLDSAQKP
jgi:para-nitrobenzyl esterase